jgi:hypothetical protein
MQCRFVMNWSIITGINNVVKREGKAIPVTGREGP